MEGILLDGMPLNALYTTSVSPSKKFSQSANYIGGNHRIGGGDSFSLNLSISSKDSEFIQAIFNYLRGGFDTIAPSEDDTFTVRGISAKSNTSTFSQSAGGLTGDGQFSIGVDIEWESPSIVSAIAPRWNGTSWDMHSYNGTERVNMVETSSEISISGNTFTATAGTYSNIVFLNFSAPDKFLRMMYTAFMSGNFKKPDRYYEVTFDGETFKSTSKNVKMVSRNGVYELTATMEKI